MLTPPFYVFESAIPESLITAIRTDAKNLQLFSARVGPGPGEQVDRLRSSLVGFFSDDHWANGILYHFAAIANARSWRLPLIAPSPAQVAIYREGSFFDWHIDYAQIRQGQNLERKISVVINISAHPLPAGGVLELRSDWGELGQLTSPGSVAVFPSLTLHRVTPVIQGERISLTSWILGPIQ